MNKARNWAGGAAAVLLVLTLLAVLLLQFINNARVSSFRPLEKETLLQLGQAHNIPEKSSGIGRGQEGFPQSNTSVSDESAAPVAGLVGQNEKSANSLLQLSRALTREDLLREFRPRSSPLADAYRRFHDDSQKLLETLFWATDGEGDGERARQVGGAAMRRGDLEEARNYLRSALKTALKNQDHDQCQRISASLAWVEDDPEVAAALLEASCAADDHTTESMKLFFVQNALIVSILTGSDALAEHYYARWGELEPGTRFIANIRIEPGGSEPVEAWIREWHPELYETARVPNRWGQPQKREESGAKIVG